MVDHAREDVVAGADSGTGGNPLDPALDQPPHLVGTVRDAVRAVAVGAALAGGAVVVTVWRRGLALELVGDQVCEAIELDALRAMANGLR